MAPGRTPHSYPSSYPHSSPSSSSFVPSGRLLAWTLAVGAVLVLGALHDGRPPQPSQGQAFSALPGPTAGRHSAPAAGSGVPPLPRSAPLRLRIPSAHVNASFTELGLDASGALRPPPADRPDLAGWYGRGTAPGSVGTAVTAGHVDLPAGSPGVFFELGAVAKGDTIEVDRKDRRTAVFTVDAVELYDKERFPSEKVYGGSGRAELRVITCGGDYTERTGYRGNIVVFAHLTAVR